MNRRIYEFTKIYQPRKTGGSVVIWGTMVHMVQAKLEGRGFHSIVVTTTVQTSELTTPVYYDI
jgi:hypothetical protein